MLPLFSARTSGMVLQSFRALPGVNVLSSIKVRTSVDVSLAFHVQLPLDKVRPGLNVRSSLKVLAPFNVSLALNVLPPAQVLMSFKVVSLFDVPTSLDALPLVWDATGIQGADVFPRGAGLEVQLSSYAWASLRVFSPLWDAAAPLRANVLGMSPAFKVQLSKCGQPLGCYRAQGAAIFQGDAAAQSVLVFQCATTVNVLSSTDRPGKG